jgi:hypothetical protein
MRSLYTQDSLRVVLLILHRHVEGAWSDAVICDVRVFEI